LVIESVGREIQCVKFRIVEFLEGRKDQADDARESSAQCKQAEEEQNEQGEKPAEDCC
jgi:hypothetical protein